MSIRAFRLITGEYLIAAEAKGSSDRFVLVQPHLVIMHEMGNNAVQLRLQPWLGVKRAILYKHAICAEIPEKEIPQQILDGLAQATSGIALARTMPPANA